MAPEVEQPSVQPPAGTFELRGVSMTSMHGWDAGSVLTLVLGLIATIALAVALVRGFIHGD